MTESMIQNSFQRRGDQTSLNRATRFPAANNERSPTDGRSPQLTTLPTKSTSSTISVVDRRLSHLDTLASESIHVIREVVAVRRPHSSSPVARTSPCSCTWRRRRADPSASPPAVQVDTSQIFPEVLNDRDKAGGQSRRAPRRGVGAGGHRPRLDSRATRSRSHAQTAPDLHPAEWCSRRTVSTPSSEAAGATRRRRGRRSGSSRCATSSVSGKCSAGWWRVL